MSEQEIKRRQEFKRMRKKWSVIQLIAVVLLLFIALASFLIYNRMDRNQYVEYAESATVEYKVQYVPNQFFEDEWIEKGKSYISELVKSVSADFSYKLNANASTMLYEYSYYIDATLKIVSDKNGATYYTISDVIVPEKSTSAASSIAPNIKETVSINYVRYNEIAKTFIKTYNIKDAKATLSVNLVTKTDCENTAYSGDHSLNFTETLNIPLALDTFTINSTANRSLAPSSFEFDGLVNRDLFLDTSIIALVLALLVILTLLVFLRITRNEDITYAAKINKIYRAYSPFIQRIDGGFDFTGYQTVIVKTFNEMLGIRDTIQSPVLMSENKDETMTQFLIPTNTKLLYVFEIKVDNYDEIYSRNIDVEPQSEPSTDTAPVITEEVQKVVEVEETTTPVCENQPTTEEILSHIEESGEGEDTLTYVDDTGARMLITCKRSFTANLIQSNPQVKSYYNELKNFILSYKGVKSRINWRIEGFNRGRINLFKLKIRGKTICLYCALDPDEFDKAKYFHEKTDAKAFAGTPMLIRIKSDRGLKRAKALCELVMQRFDIPLISDYSEVDFAGTYPYDTTKHLVSRGLIKILLPGATAAEPQPHHHTHKALSEEKEEKLNSDEAAEVIVPADEAVEEETVEAIDTSSDIVSHLVETDDNSDELAYVNDAGEQVMISCKRSFTANLIQSNPQVKSYYNELKNFILSYKGVKSRINWRIEGFNRGRINLFKLKIRGKTICLYCALNPDEFDKAKYFHEKTDAKAFASTPMLIRIKSDRGLKRAKALCELVMQRFDIPLISDYSEVDFAGAYPYDTTKRLVGRGLIKILLPGATAAEPQPHHHTHKALSDKQ